MTAPISSTRTTRIPASRLRASDCYLPDLLAILAQGTDAADYPHAADIVSGVVVYDAAALHDAINKQEKEIGGAKGDHFGIPGANDRIWNVQEKLAVHDPEAFVEYYDNPFVALCSHAWLGPGLPGHRAAQCRPSGRQGPDRRPQVCRRQHARRRSQPGDVECLTRAPTTRDGALNCPAADLVTEQPGDTVEHLGDRSSYPYQPEAFPTAVRAGHQPIAGIDFTMANARLIDDVYAAAGLPCRVTAAS